MEKSNKVAPLIPTLFLTEPEGEKPKAGEVTIQPPQPVLLVLPEHKHPEIESGHHDEISPTSHDSLLDSSTGSDVSEVSPEEFYHQEKRLKWHTPIDSLLLCLAYCNGFSNIEAFPQSCVAHGGAAFIFAYTVLLFAVAIPIAYLEMAMGQFVQQGSLGVWKLIPLLKGLAYVILFFNIGTAMLFSVFSAWILAFIDSAFGDSKKWAICQNQWNTKYCVDFSVPEVAESSFATLQNHSGRFAMEEFYRGWILKEKFKPGSSNETVYGFNKLGTVDPRLSIYLVISYLAILLVLGFGHRFQARVATFTLGLPLFLHSIITFRSITIPGAYLGLEYFFEGNTVESFFEYKLWKDAGLQTLYSTGVGTAAYITIGSYNKFKHPILGDIVQAFLLHEISCIVSTIDLYCLLGSMSLLVHHEVNELSSFGISKVAFQTFPDIISRVPGAKNFILMFYVMMILNIWDTFMVTVEILITTVVDANAKFFRLHKYARMTILFIVASVTSIVGFASVTPGGVYHIAVLMTGFSGLTQAVCSLIFVLSFVSIFGIEGIIHSIQAMNPNTSRWVLLYFEICWAVVIPLFLGYLTIFDWLTDEVPEWYRIPVPTSGHWVARIIKYGPALICIPVTSLVVLLWSRGKSLQMKFLVSISPLHEHEEIIETGTCVRSRCIQCCFIAHWYRTILHKTFEHKVKLIEETGVAEDDDDPGGLVVLEEEDKFGQSLQVIYSGSSGSLGRSKGSLGSGNSPVLSRSSTSLTIPLASSPSRHRRKHHNHRKYEDYDD